MLKSVKISPLYFLFTVLLSFVDFFLPGLCTKSAWIFQCSFHKFNSTSHQRVKVPADKSNLLQYRKEKKLCGSKCTVRDMHIFLQVPNASLSIMAKSWHSAERTNEQCLLWKQLGSWHQTKKGQQHQVTAKKVTWIILLLCKPLIFFPIHNKLLGKGARFLS